MKSEYRHLGFPTDEAFIEYHQRRAEAGDQMSKQILATRSRIDLAVRARKARETEPLTENKHESDLVAQALEVLGEASKLTGYSVVLEKYVQ